MTNTSETSPLGSITVSVNGEQRLIPLGATLADLVAEMNLQGKRIAIERNLEIIPKAEHGTTILQANDVVEIVHAIGGG